MNTMPLQVDADYHQASFVGVWGDRQARHMGVRIIVQIEKHAVLIALITHVEERIGHRRSSAGLLSPAHTATGQGTVWYGTRETSQRERGRLKLACRYKHPETGPACRSREDLLSSGSSAEVDGPIALLPSWERRKRREAFDMLWCV